MRISVVVPTFNQLKLTDIAVEMLYLCTQYDDWECVIVDDGSTDGTYEHFAAMAAKRTNMKIIRRTKDVGRYSNGGLARNCGIKAATGDIIACMDSDILHFTDPVSRTVQAFAENAKQYGNRMFVTSSNWYRVFYKNSEVKIVAEVRGNVGPLPFGAWIAAHRDIWNELGGYDERFTTYGAEDNDICGRLHRAGVKNIMCADIFAVHPHYSISYEGDRKDPKQFEAQLQFMSYDRTIQRNVDEEWGALA